MGICAYLGPGVGRRGAPEPEGKENPGARFCGRIGLGGWPEQGPPNSSLGGSRSTPHPGRGRGAFWKNKTLGWPEICLRETWKSSGLSISSPVFFTTKLGVFGGLWRQTVHLLPLSILPPRMRSWFTRVVLGFMVLAMPEDTGHNP